jgi:hypothetical protein
VQQWSVGGRAGTDIVEWSVIVEWPVKTWGAGTDLVEWLVKKWGAGTDMVEWSAQKLEAGTNVVEWSIKKWGVRVDVSNDLWKMRAGTYVVNSSSHFPMIGAQLCLLSINITYLQLILIYNPYVYCCSLAYMFIYMFLFLCFICFLPNCVKPLLGLWPTGMGVLMYSR